MRELRRSKKILIFALLIVSNKKETDGNESEQYRYTWNFSPRKATVCMQVKLYVVQPYTKI